jgi:hypothetical protein
MRHVPPSSSALPTTTWRFRPLLLSLLLLMLLSPYVEGRRLVLEGLMVAVLLAGLYSVSRKRRLLWLSCLLAIPTFLVKALSLLTAHQPLELASQVGAALLLSYTTALILWYVLAETEITRDTLSGAVCVYLLSGVTWMTLYRVLETLHPGSFVVSAAQHAGQGVTWSDLVFFSFVTLTTLGYGDVLPVTSPARSLVVLEAVFGVLYPAILVARLVGLYRPPAASR